MLMVLLLLLNVLSLSMYLLCVITRVMLWLLLWFAAVMLVVCVCSVIVRDAIADEYVGIVPICGSEIVDGALFLLVCLWFAVML